MGQIHGMGRRLPLVHCSKGPSASMRGDVLYWLRPVISLPCGPVMPGFEVISVSLGSSESDSNRGDRKIMGIRIKRAGSDGVLVSTVKGRYMCT
jgi:hypothetical protein